MTSAACGAGNGLPFQTTDIFQVFLIIYNYYNRFRRVAAYRPCRHVPTHRFQR